MRATQQPSHTICYTNMTDAESSTQAGKATAAYQHNKT
jgi:hypothetical protein